MSDYASDISTSDYIYMKEITVSEISGEDQVDLPVKLNFSSSNFNFELARSDGKDLRIAEYGNGSRVLNMWIASWTVSYRVGTVWLKIPLLEADETKTLYVFWGNSSDSGISDINSIGFLFSDGFDSSFSDINLALNKTCAQSSTYGGVPAENAVDGNVGTYNHTNANSNEWWKVDLGAVYSIGFITIIKRVGFGDRPEHYHIQTADDYAFTTNVVNIITTTTDEDSEIITYSQDDFGSVSTRYLRVYCHTNGQYINIAEFVVYAADSKWIYGGVSSISDSKLRIYTNGYIEAQGTPLSGLTNWIVEEGIYVNSGGSSDYTTHRWRFYGTENNFGYDYYIEGGNDRRSNVLNSSDWVNYTGDQKGLESDSYSENFIAYYEPTDKVHQSMKNRNSYVDYEDSIERQVYGDTRATYFRIYGREDSNAPYTDIDWVIIREFTVTDPYSFDTSDLLVPWEQIDHQTIDYTQYDSDLTSINYYHYSSFGGDPYKLSNNAYNTSTDCWFSDSNTVVSGIDLIIDFARSADNLVSTSYLHYDSGHVGWKNASKLSDSDTDVWSNDYFQSTSTSGYVCIDFGDDRTDVGCLSVKAHTTTGGMIKNFVFKGLYSNFRTAEDSDWETLYTGTFNNTLNWQPIYFDNDRRFRYYKLEIIDTYGSENASLQEWEMYKYNDFREKKVISQVRLRPVVVDSSEIYFPKWIEIKGSNGMDEWDTIVSLTNTYTPFYDYVWGRWQRYSFENINSYYSYKVTCSGNWNNHTDKMGISEWEMVEKVSEIHTHRILSGDSDNYNSVWALDNTTFNNGFVYISNEGVNTVYNEELVSYTTVSGIIDMNVL